MSAETLSPSPRPPSPPPHSVLSCSARATFHTCSSVDGYFFIFLVWNIPKLELICFQDFFPLGEGSQSVLETISLFFFFCSITALLRFFSVWVCEFCLYKYIVFPIHSDRKKKNSWHQASLHITCNLCEGARSLHRQTLDQSLAMLCTLYQTSPILSGYMAGAVCSQGDFISKLSAFNSFGINCSRKEGIHSQEKTDNAISITFNTDTRRRV